MPSLKTIRRRITSVKSTQKTTKAMKMVAAARLRRATEAIVELRPYARHTEELVTNLLARAQEGGAHQDGGDPIHPLLVQRPLRSALVVLFTSDRGLAGAFNANAQKAAYELAARLKSEGVRVRFAVVGRKGREYLTRRQLTVDFDWAARIDSTAVQTPGELVRQFLGFYAAEEFDACYLVYSRFLSAIRQEVQTKQLLPVEVDVASRESLGGDFLYEPNRTALIDTLMPMYVHVQLYRALLESRASEHGARMAAMDAATSNASKMISRLTLQFNRARQASITKELIEILGGAQALEG